MKTNRIAAIDIGTNTILMVIGEKAHDGKLIILRDEHDIARLGEGVDSNKLIQPIAIERAKKILTKYKAICDSLQVDKIVAAGTSALRDSSNKDEVCWEFASILNSEINIIPGETEANLSFLGTAEGLSPSLVLDIGGGSTEFIYGKDNHVESKISLQMGVVRITERIFRGTHPPSPDNLIEASGIISKELAKVEIPKNKYKFYAVAGTPTTIAAMALNLKEYDYQAIHGFILKKEELDRIYNIFLSSSINDLIEIYGIHPKRADVITAGALILKEAMNYLKLDECIVSAHGLRYGILKDAFWKIDVC
jgi:exopolyphosphatase / guanosine-5'-triphosphate,3'-diphosphate pyrophosphatase